MRTMTAPVPLSFLVPSYNPGQYLQATVESIEDQLVDGDEVIVQDGGSNDGSVEALVSRYGDKPWLKVVSERDSGQADALQKALERTTNDYLMWLNADDIIYPGVLAAVREGLRDKPDLLGGRSTIFKNDGRIVRTYTPGAFTREAFIGLGSNMFTGSFVYRTELVREVGGFNADYQYCMDMDLFARLSEREPSVVYIPDVIGGLRWHDDSKGATTLWPIIREATEIRLAHSRTLRERVRAVSASAAYWVGGMTQPLRHTAFYSAVRNRLRRPVRRHHAPAP
jgi:glycosyltransferase involved in cell wall biosynthesis